MRAPREVRLVECADCPTRLSPSDDGEMHFLATGHTVIAMNVRAFEADPRRRERERARRAAAA